MKPKSRVFAKPAICTVNFCCSPKIEHGGLCANDKMGVLSRANRTYYLASTLIVGKQRYLTFVASTMIKTSLRCNLVTLSSGHGACIPHFPPSLKPFSIYFSHVNGRCVDNRVKKYNRVDITIAKW